MILYMKVLIDPCGGGERIPYICGYKRIQTLYTFILLHKCTFGRGLGFTISSPIKVYTYIKYLDTQIILRIFTSVK